MRAGSSCLPRHPEDPAPGPPSQRAPPPPPCWAQPRPRSTPSVALGPQTHLNKQRGVKPAIWNSLPGSGRTTSRASRGGAGGQPAHSRMVCAQEAVGEGEGWASPREPASAGQLPWGLGPWPPAAPRGSSPGRPCARGALGRQDGHVPAAVTSFKSALSPSVPPSCTGASSPAAQGGPRAVLPTPHHLSGARPHGWRAPGPHTRRRTFSCSGSCTWAVCLRGWGMWTRAAASEPPVEGRPGPQHHPPPEHPRAPGQRIAAAGG